MLHDHTNENQESSQTKHKMYGIETKSNPPRAQGGKGLFPMSIHIQSLNNPWLKTYPREEKGGTRKEAKEESPGRGVVVLDRKSVV